MSHESDEPGADTDRVSANEIELPSPSGSEGPEIVFVHDIPPAPPVPVFDRESPTLPPGIEDTGEWQDPLDEDPMLHAPAWARDLSSRLDGLTAALATLAQAFRERGDMRKELLRELTAWAQPYFNEFMRRDTVREQDAQIQAEKTAKLESRVTELERWRRTAEGDGR